MWKWWHGIISGETPLDVNPSVALLVEKSLQSKKGSLSSKGSLVISTGAHTGRAANDKYVVKDNFSQSVIDWENNIHQMDLATFNTIKGEVLKKINLLKNHTFVMERSVGADHRYAMGVKFISTSAPHALFCHNIFRPRLDEHPLGDFTIYHDPELELSYKRLGLKSPTVIAICFKTQEIVIAGTGYAGEIKKSIFSVMNTLLPESGILPLHSGGNINPQGKVSLFFGLSGTGKTTLSTDEGLKLIGDDEMGLSHTGVFNFEGGCYAKTFNLKEETEPEIFRATNRFGTLLENVVLDHQTREPVYHDRTVTENGRATYSLQALEDFVFDGKAGIPSNIFFLSADALGVLPAVSKLDHDQAMFYFLSGYTAKLAGTELGATEVQTVFSHSFGAPFMMRRPMDYGILLKQFLKNHDITVWLINTGWYGGIYGLGRRYPLSFTRDCIRAIQHGAGEKAIFVQDDIFSLSIPVELGDVDSHYLHPVNLWPDEETYRASAISLRDRLISNFKKFHLRPDESSSAGL